MFRAGVGGAYDPDGYRVRLQGKTWVTSPGWRTRNPVHNRPCNNAASFNPQFYALLATRLRMDCAQIAQYSLDDCAMNLQLFV